MLTGAAENVRARNSANHGRGKKEKREPPDFLPVQRFQSLPAGAACIEDLKLDWSQRLHSIPRVILALTTQNRSLLFPRGTRVVFPKSVHPRQANARDYDPHGPTHLEIISRDQWWSENQFRFRGRQIVFKIRLFVVEIWSSVSNLVSWGSIDYRRFLSSRSIRFSKRKNYISRAY